MSQQFNRYLRGGTCDSLPGVGKVFFFFFFFFFFGSWLVYSDMVCLQVHLGIIGRLCSVIVALPGNLLYMYKFWSNNEYTSTVLTSRLLQMSCALEMVDWLQSPVIKYFFLIIMFNNPLKENQKKYHDYKGCH